MSTNTRMHSESFCVFFFYRTTWRPRHTSLQLECHHNTTNHLTRSLSWPYSECGMPWTKGSSHCSTQCVHPGAATGSGWTWEDRQTHETPHDRDREQLGYTLGSRTVYALLIEGGLVGSIERGGNEDPVEGREGGVTSTRRSVSRKILAP